MQTKGGGWTASILDLGEDWVPGLEEALEEDYEPYLEEGYEPYLGEGYEPYLDEGWFPD